MALIQKAPELFIDPPEIQRLEILACKPPWAAFRIHGCAGSGRRLSSSF